MKGAPLRHCCMHVLLIFLFRLLNFLLLFLLLLPALPEIPGISVFPFTFRVQPTNSKPSLVELPLRCGIQKLCGLSTASSLPCSYHVLILTPVLHSCHFSNLCSSNQWPSTTTSVDSSTIGLPLAYYYHAGLHNRKWQTDGNISGGHGSLAPASSIIHACPNIRWEPKSQSTTTTKTTTCTTTAGVTPSSLLAWPKVRGRAALRLLLGEMPTPRW